MDRTIFIHAGMHKTGSTAIQMFLTGNRDRLRELGVYLPVVGTESHDHNHTALVGAITSTDPAEPGDACERLRAELAQAGNPRHVLISAEKFSTRIGHLPFLDKLGRLCAALGYAPHIIAYIRPQAAAINSMYTQKVKNWLTVEPFHVYFQSQLAAPMNRFPRLFAALRADPRFRLTVRPYNRRIISAGLVKDFLGILGLPADDPGFTYSHDMENVTPGAKTIRAFLQIGRRLANRQPMPDQAILNSLTPPLIAAAGRLGWNAAKFDGIDDIRLRRALARFAESNEEFAHAAWNKSWHDVFPEEKHRQANPSIFFLKDASPAEQAEFRDFVAEATASIRQFHAGLPQSQSGDD